MTLTPGKGGGGATIVFFFNRTIAQGVVRDRHAIKNLFFLPMRDRRAIRSGPCTSFAHG
jgi:hypothetical protein